MTIGYSFISVSTKGARAGGVCCPKPAETYVLLAVKPSLVTIRPERAFLQTKAAMGKKQCFLIIFFDALPVYILHLSTLIAGCNATHGNIFISKVTLL